MYFNEAAFTELEKRIRAGAGPDGAEDRELLQDIMADLHQYVDTVIRGEIRIRAEAKDAAGQEYRDLITAYDSERHTAHETAISGTKILNRLAKRYGTEPVFTGDETQRHQIADFCLEYDGWLFANRMKKLS